MRITVPVLRDLAMLAVGSAGMVHELFLVGSPSTLRVTASMALMAGSAVLNGWWFGQRGRNGTGESTPTGPPPSPLPSSSSPSGP